jgi:transposase
VSESPSFAAELAELRAGLAEARVVIRDLREIIEAKDAALAAKDLQVAALRATNEVQAEQLVTLAARVEELERQKGRDSGNSGKPPSSDSIYTKKPAVRDRSQRERGRRNPGKQPGEPGTTMKLIDNPDVRIECPPAACDGCGAELVDVPVERVQRRQVTEAQPAPPPVTTEFVVQAKRCSCCGTISVGQAPPFASGRAQFGPETHAMAANLVCGHHIPIKRATLLLAQMAGIEVATGWTAAVRGKVAALLAGGGFAEHLRELLRTAPALHVDETPARANGALAYVHVACTQYLTLMHTGGRSADDIDDGGVLPGYRGIIVRDGYSGYAHLTDALHAWCGAHLLRDLKDLYEFEPKPQAWANAMATLLCEANEAAKTARAADQVALPEQVLADLLARYRELVSQGFTSNLYRRTRVARDAVRLARRFRKFEDMILRFVTHPDLVAFTNNEAERTIRPVKMQMRSSGGCWRTLRGLADFALVHSYLSTAAKWGIDKLDALKQLFTTGRPWLPPALTPATAT